MSVLRWKVTGRPRDYTGPWASPCEVVLASDYDDAVSALRLLYAEMVASGNANATDFGWPKAIREARRILGAASTTRAGE